MWKKNRHVAHFHSNVPGIRFDFDWLWFDFWLLYQHTQQLWRVLMVSKNPSRTLSYQNLIITIITIPCLFLSISVVVAVVSVAVVALAIVPERSCPAWTTNRNYQPWDWPLDLWALEGFVEIEGLVAQCCAHINMFVGYCTSIILYIYTHLPRFCPTRFFQH